MKKEEIIHEVEEICKKHSVEHLFLFGSYAKGTETPTSDMDFLSLGDRISESFGMKLIGSRH